MEKKALGRGLDALLPSTKPASRPELPEIQHLRVDAIVPNRYQPRQTFAPQELAELAVSLKQSGLLQPILVRRKGDGIYELTSLKVRLFAGTSGSVAVAVADHATCSLMFVFGGRNSTGGRFDSNTTTVKLFVTVNEFVFTGLLALKSVQVMNTTFVLGPSASVVGQNMVPSAPTVRPLGAPETFWIPTNAKVRVLTGMSGSYATMFVKKVAPSPSVMTALFVGNKMTGGKLDSNAST